MRLYTNSTTVIPLKYALLHEMWTHLMVMATLDLLLIDTHKLAYALTNHHSKKNRCFENDKCKMCFAPNKTRITGKLRDRARALSATSQSHWIHIINVWPITKKRTERFYLPIVALYQWKKRHTSITKWELQTKLIFFQMENGGSVQRQQKKKTIVWSSE